MQSVRWCCLICFESGVCARNFRECLEPTACVSA